MIAAVACSDDGVPAVETTASESSGGFTASDTATDPTTQTTSATTGTSVSTSASSTDPTDSSTNADPTTDTDPTRSDTSGDPTVDPASTGEAESSSDGTQGSSDSSSDGTQGSSSGSSSSESGNGVLPTGDPCDADSDCASGVCWDWADYVPECGGTACSASCQSDEECEQLILDANGENPAGAFCGKDGRCWMQGTGFGQYFCEGG